MNARTRFLLAAACCLCASPLVSALDNPIPGTRVEETAETLRLLQDGQLVLVYHKARRIPPEGIDPVFGRNAHLHPVMTPDGRVLTDEFPPDHAHQSGLWNAWTATLFQERRVDFWNLYKRQGFVEHRRVLALHADPQRPGFTVEIAHVDLTSGEPIDVLIEELTVRLAGMEQGLHAFDLETRQRLAGPDPLTIRKYTYGGVAIRLNRDWFGGSDAPNAPRYLTSTGLDREEGDQTPMAWLFVEGDLEEQPAALVAMSHPDNFRHPQPVRIHNTMPYFVWSPGNQESFIIGKDTPYHARYRYVVADRLPDPAEVETWYARYRETP